MEDIYGKILWEGYGLKYYGGKRTRTGLVCQTDRGLRELKKARSHKQEILFAHAVKTCLFRNGFSGICFFYTTLEGQPYWECDGECYVLEDPMPGKAVEEETAAHFVEGASLMAKMHRAAIGLQYSKEDTRGEPLPQLWRRRLNEMAKMKRRMERKGGYSPLDLLVLRYYTPFFGRAEEALECLDASYADLCRIQRQEGTFCHNQFKGSHLYRREDGAWFVGGFEHCTSDVFVLDLASYLRRFWRKTEGTEEQLQQVLEAYLQMRPINAAEKEMLLPLTLYPIKFLRLIHEYDNKRRVCVSPAMQERLSAAAQEEEKIGALGRLLERVL